MPTPSAPPADAVARFRADLERLTGPRARAPLGLAVSGGPDSLALLLLAHAALPDGITVATVDHGLRPQAASEAAMVRDLCTARGIPHATLGPEPLAAGNISEQARLLRYRLLGQWAADQQLPHIAVAHHRDDVAETLLMRAMRGAGVRGLARMAAHGPMPGAAGVTLLRPLLDWPRAALATIVDKAGLVPVDDPANGDPRYDRARVRALLGREAMLDPAMLALAATNLADADAALEWLVDQAARTRITQGANGHVRVDAEGLPREIRRRLATRAVTGLDPLWSGTGIDTLLERLETGRTATLGRVGARFHDGAWLFRIAPPHARAR